mmetsp:Transcript_9929/g.11501  ORF Transcript_9929/g.11501 Transcript_9929/m.11501 type:complete len:137 (+) Transcript_9929:78-488(+)|eukprot:CAMPEP_0197848470 /NCGR_PEP_ID=MMETSP1438-20131217/8841_1 /TAXON_ID=1461541 /ORGANISM="Pterosperma sp., Strain CCMP1384" /LENGTH=136 /DNA_ID=CAMNT_0043460735 /DNA_START=78 /DNA_END=488 /DNA_ORIENTATION=+
MVKYIVQTTTAPFEKWEVELDISDPIAVTKKKLEKVTKIPADSQILRHDHIRIFVGDKRTNIKFGAFPTVNAVWNPHPTYEQSQKGVKMGDKDAGFVHIGPSNLVYPGCSYEGRPEDGFTSRDAPAEAYRKAHNMA